MSDLKSKIESILFTASRPVKLAELVRTLGAERAEVEAALAEMASEKQGNGVILLSKNGKYQLASSPDNAKAVGDFINADLRERLTDAALETLAIVLYKQPVSRAEIEAIRGVNSQYILRQLSMRGLVEKAFSPDDARKLVYSTTLEFMASLGIRSMAELPDFEQLTKAVTLTQAPENNPQAAVDKQQEIGDNSNSEAPHV